MSELFGMAFARLGTYYYQGRLLHAGLGCKKRILRYILLWLRMLVPEYQMRLNSSECGEGGVTHVPMIPKGYLKRCTKSDLFRVMQRDASS